MSFGQAAVPYQLDPANVQALLLNQAFGVAALRYGFVQLDATAGAPRTRAWLRRLLDGEILDMDRADLTSRANVNVALTYRGLQQLGVQYQPPDRPWQKAGSPFEVGMAQRSDLMGEVAGPDQWDWDAAWRGADGRDEGSVDMLVWISAWDAEQLDATSARVFGVDPAAVPQRFEGGVLLGTTDSGMLEDRLSHFGFRDGVSQPYIRQVHDQDRFNAFERQPLEGSGVHENDGSWRAVELGEFLLGYPGEWLPQTSTEWRFDGPRDGDQDFFVDGSFVVWRKLEQHVDRYAEFLEQNAPAYAGLHGWPVDEGRFQLAARVVGRYPYRLPERRDGSIVWTTLDDPRSGRPLPTDLSGGTDGYGPAANSFGYADHDGTGRRCPFSAHMRRANPRDSLAQPRLTSRHRLIRRSYPYGTLDTSRPQGLIFVGVCADLEAQFEFIKRDWLNDGRPFEQGTDPDPIAGVFEGPRTIVVHGERAFMAHLDAPMLTLRGGDYFFAPSMRSLRLLASASDTAGQPTSTSSAARRPRTSRPRSSAVRLA